ncbi:adenosylmethionine--8-amino-7-oxononanoate transaminase [Reinekea forsetii]|jgi:adenosylmethionine-8-amino-7-oxononanoate aminotransferase|uniref:Adenosylmethionine-8-amino-7-oxononanoate aminotransferase n=1 Tax=Reinekea forsetii TaxID=1336806 RepID=A0A2K8KTW1_9GAMM|nr:adenosylmethionine--8-amino-7-oxononanoate transaminase [Reinekea forsetii]ATX76336.1 adenosylmethionine-8-amino-7-oxononanoate aminotransferase [Reinekea forsetii]
MTIDLDFDRDHLWHPYTSTSAPLPCYPVESAHGVRLKFENGDTVIDAMASWWSAVHGYNVPELNDALINQTGKMAHVMFGGLTHEPAIELGKLLVAMTPEPLQKVFLADSGSIAVEVALKMAIQYWSGRDKPTKTRMVTVNRGYHGDTFGAMSVCDPTNGMHSLFESVLPESLFLGDLPQGYSQPLDPELMQHFEQQIKEHADTLAAFIIEPVVQGAGGMRIYNPQWLVQIRVWCERYNILLIFDEIATGFGRTGKLFALEHAQVVPDILCLGKALSGGYMTLAATLATDEVAAGVSASPAGVFMHGPTFMANPLACAVAGAALRLLEQKDWAVQVGAIETQLQQALLPLAALASVAEVRVLGAIGVMEMVEQVDVAQAQALFIDRGVWLRPFGKLIYIMPAYVMTPADLQTVVDAMAAFARSLILTEPV